jgi:hypothetical protein
MIQASAAYSVIGGGQYNLVDNSAQAATIGGGGAYGFPNHISSTLGAIAGGSGNTIQGSANDSTIGGGRLNEIDTNDWGAVIAGGHGNWIQAGFNPGGNAGNSSYSTISGGYQNTIQTNANNSVIGGGLFNVVGASWAVIAGGDQNGVGNNAAGGFIGAGYLNSIQSAPYCVIGGGYENSIQSGLGYSVIGGGFYNTIQTNASYSAIVSGNNNTIQTNANESVINGGYQNVIGSDNGGSTIGGGFLNQIQSYSYFSVFSANTIAGGQNNIIQSNTLWATIGGGINNTNGNYYATVPGGYGNFAGGEYSFAAGNRAQALYPGDFVWADSQNTNFAATAANQVSFRCQGGVVFTSGSGAANQTVAWTPGSASWSFSSDRNLKDRFATVDAVSVLDRVSQLPIAEWSYKGYSQRHIGAMAQDFHALFPLNNDDKSLNDADLHGVELAAIQGLNEKVESGKRKAETQIEELKAENAELKQRLDALEKIVLNQKSN